MLKIITNDKALDFAVSEILREIKDSDKLSGEFIAKKVDKGLSVKEAYSAANPDLVRSSAAKAAKKSSSGKEHLRSVTGKGVTGKSDIVIPSREMATLRELFPGKSDAEIRKLYKATI